MSKQNNLKDYLTDLYEGISTKRPNASRNPQNFRAEIESIESGKAKLQEKTLTANGVYPPDSGYDGFSKVTVDVAGKVLPKYDGEVIIEGEPESGGGGGGSAEFNIAYGDTAPTDTSKLWVKASEPSKVIISSQFETADSIEHYISALPTAALDIGAAAVGTNIYLFGGRADAKSFLNTIQVFDTETNTISTLSATLKTAASDIGVAAVGTKIYLFGGFNNTSFFNTIQVFDTETNSISTLSATLKTAAFSIGVAAVGTKIYLFGGVDSGYSSLNTIQVFDTETNSISTLSATLPTAAKDMGVAAVGTKIYLFGGEGSSYMDTIQVFDTETDAISALSTTLPTAAFDVAAAAVGTKIYLFGGRDSSSYMNTIQVFDTETNSISTLSVTLPTAARKIGAAAVGAKVYLFGGQSSNYLNTINCFTLLSFLEAGVLQIIPSITDNVFDLINSETTIVSIGVNNVYLGNADGNGEKVEAYLHNGTEWVEV